MIRTTQEEQNNTRKAHTWASLNTRKGDRGVEQEAAEEAERGGTCAWRRAQGAVARRKYRGDSDGAARPSSVNA